MRFTTDADRFDAAIEQRGPATNTPLTSFSENFGAAFDEAVDENWTISEWLHDDPKRGRNEKLRMMMASGQIPDSVADSYRIPLEVSNPNSWTNEFDYNALSMYVKFNLDDTVMSDKDIDDKTREDLKVKREEHEDIFERSDGNWGRGVGTLAGYALDPINIPASAIGMGAAARATTLIGKLAIGAGINAAVGGGTEAIIQSQVYDWKHKLGVDYAIDDAITNVAFAATGGAIFGAGVVGVGEFARYIGKVLREAGPGSVDHQAAVQALEHLETEVYGAPSKDMPVKAHLQNIEREGQTIKLKRPLVEAAKELQEEVPVGKEGVVDDMFNKAIDEGEELKIVHDNGTEAIEMDAQAHLAELTDEIDAAKFYAECISYV